MSQVDQNGKHDIGGQGARSSAFVAGECPAQVTREPLAELGSGLATHALRSANHRSGGDPDRVRALRLLASTLVHSTVLAKMKQSGDPLVVPIAATEPDCVATAGWAWLRANVAVPIRARDPPMGHLRRSRTRPGQIGTANARCLQALARGPGRQVGGLFTLKCTASFHPLSPAEQEV